MGIMVWEINFSQGNYHHIYQFQAENSRLSQHSLTPRVAEAPENIALSLQYILAQLSGFSVNLRKDAKLMKPPVTTEFRRKPLEPS